MKFKISFLLIYLFVIAPLLPAGQDQTMIPDCLLSYRYGPRQYVVIVEKSTQTLYIYSNYEPDPVEKFTVTTGKNTGQKLVEGDMKTPEGIYFFRRSLSGEQLPKSDDYGDRAFTMNYPNPVDRKQDRDGSGIWLHGAFDSEKTESPHNSRGCVVMNNDDMKKVSKYINLNDTPIVIYDTVGYESVAKMVEKRGQFLKRLTSWKTDWESKKLDDYISYYDGEFRYGGMNLRSFKSHKKGLNERYRFIRVLLSGINVYCYRGYFVAMFNQLYVSDVNHFYNHKVQYWLRESTGPRIVSEFSVRLPSTDKFQLPTGNYITINQFRRDVLAELDNQGAPPTESIPAVVEPEAKPEARPVDLVPGAINLAKISVLERSVKLLLKNDNVSRGLRVVPVMLLKNGSGTEYRTLDGVILEDGVPGNDARGIAVDGSGNNTVDLPREKGGKIKSLTLFVINRDNEFEQIITYLVDL